MSTILALDGSADCFSVAIRCDQKTWQYTDDKQPYSLIALPLIEQALKERQLTLNDIDVFAFSAGPGRFSQLRFICALAKTFAYAINKPLVAVPTFIGVANANFPSASPPAIKTLKCCLPGNREYALLGLCEWKNTHWTLQSKRPPLAKIKDACGAGFALYPHLLGDATHHQHALHSNAAAIAAVGERMWQAGETTSPLDCTPLYVRHKVAQTIKERLKSKLK